ncbi:transcriptional regulator, TetR family [Burkholderia sp. D7]|nr:transcriptional regulator, TetR family [Burkholderia sp. D7]
MKDLPISQRDEDLNLIQRAGDLLCRHGLHRVGMDALASGIGTHKMTIYRLVGSKEGLCVAYVELLGRQRADEWALLRQRFSGKTRQLISAYFAGEIARTRESGFIGDQLLKLACEAPPDFKKLRSALQRQKRVLYTIVFAKLLKSYPIFTGTRRLLSFTFYG